MKRFGILSVILAIGVFAAAVLFFNGTETAGKSDDSWRQLSLRDFVDEITRITSADEPVSADVWVQIRSQSAERLVGAVANNTPADYEDLVSLFLWGRPNLSDAQLETVLARLTPESNQVNSWTFDKLHSVHVRMTEAQLPASKIHGLAVAWLEDRDVRTLENVDQLAWLLEQLQMAERDEIGSKEFSVRWTGLVEAPADGQYTFSTSPFDLNFEHGKWFRKQTLSVSIAGQKVLDSGTNGWTFEGSGVTLHAGQKTPIRVELSYACSKEDVFESHPAVAMLLWEGPGMTKRLVPTGAFSTSDGQQQGLQGAYLLKTSGGDVTRNRVDSRISFIWYHGGFVVPKYDSMRSQLAEQLYTVATSAGTLATWESEGSAGKADWVGASWAFLESLDVARQIQWTQTLLAHPVLLEDCDRQAAMGVYCRCRFGAPAEALRVVGSWAQANADQLPELATGFYQTNRQAYRGLARMMVWQYREHLNQWEEEYLVMPDGNCALPVAYTLAYGYWVEKRINAWIDMLDARLDDDQLSGDARVSWLLARAQAEEIRRSPPGRYWLTMERSLAGLGWIQEASMVAQSEPVRLRAYQEMAARFTVDERLDAARQMLDKGGNLCTSPASVELLAQWRSELGELSEAFRKRHEQHEALARQAYVDRLRRRRQTALDHGNSQAASRYEQLLSDAGA